MNWKGCAEIVLAVMVIGVVTAVHALVGSLVTWHMFKRSGGVATRCPMCKRSASGVISSSSTATVDSRK